jgi:hypothetical protein
MWDVPRLSLRFALCVLRLDPQLLHHLQDPIDRGKVPLLPADVDQVDLTLAVDDVETRTLTQRPEARLDVVGPEDGAVLVGKHQEWQLELRDELLRHGQIVGCEADDLRAAPSKLFVPLAQLREVPAAEESAAIAEEDQDDRLSAPVVL